MKNQYIGLLILILILYLCINTQENLSYEDKRQYFYCKYRLGSNSPKCQHFFKNLDEKRQPLLVGVIYTKKEDNDKIYNLYKSNNDIDNGYSYYIKINKKNGEYILKRIYSGNNELFSNQEINISDHNNTYVIQLYENNENNCRSCQINPAGKHHICKNCWHSHGTRYDESLIPWNNIGYVYKLNGNKDRFFNLYEKSLDASRNNYRYYIHDVRQDVKIMLTYKDQLYLDDKISVNGKEGEYKIYKYDMEHPSYPLF